MHTLSSSCAAISGLSLASSLASAATDAAGALAGAVSWVVMGGGRRMPAGRAPTLPLMTVRLTVPCWRMVSSSRPTSNKGDAEMCQCSIQTFVGTLTCQALPCQGDAMPAVFV